MVVTGSIIGQWVSIVVGASIFFYRQTKIAGQNQEALRDARKDIARIQQCMDAIKADTRFFITVPQHDKMQKDCQGQLQAKIEANALVFNRVSSRLDKMDENREAARMNFDHRLTTIEVAMSAMSTELKHISTLLKTIADR